MFAELVVNPPTTCSFQKRAKMGKVESVKKKKKFKHRNSKEHSTEKIKAVFKNMIMSCWH